MADPQNTEPAEGSRETVEKDLARQEGKKPLSNGNEAANKKGPAQPRSGQA